MWRYNFVYPHVGWLGWIGPAFMGLLWVAIIVGIVFLIIGVVRDRRGRRSGDKALDILRERYARGEIAKEEFQDKMRELR